MAPPGEAPPGKGEASGSGSGGNGSGNRSGGRQQGAANSHAIINFREDMFPAAVTLVFLLLGLLRASFQRCYCT